MFGVDECRRKCNGHGVSEAFFCMNKHGFFVYNFKLKRVFILLDFKKFLFFMFFTVPQVSDI